MKQPTVKSSRNKADSLLTPLIIKLHPRCLLCGDPTQVAHHFVHKSKSTRLRYELDNLVPLCHKCHLRLHNNESYEAGRIIQIRGVDWFNKLQKLGQEIVKADVYYYLAAIDRLAKYL